MTKMDDHAVSIEIFFLSFVITVIKFCPYSGIVTMYA